MGHGPDLKLVYARRRHYSAPRYSSQVQVKVRHSPVRSGKTVAVNGRASSIEVKATPEAAP